MLRRLSVEVSTGNAWSRLTFAVLTAVFFVTEPTGAADQLPYRFGYLVDASGPQQTTIKPAYDAFRLYVDELNKNGGINGRKVEILARDTQSDVQR
jgi:branched-chain amino acid transport system substrate-binding protein